MPSLGQEQWSAWADHLVAVRWLQDWCSAKLSAWEKGFVKACFLRLMARKPLTAKMAYHLDRLLREHKYEPQGARSRPAPPPADDLGAGGRNIRLED